MEILTFSEWVQKQFTRALETGLVTEKQLTSAWLIVYTESLSQKRRDLAPIDEPCQQWLTNLHQILTTLTNK